MDDPERLENALLELTDRFSDLLELHSELDAKVRAIETATCLAIARNTEQDLIVSGLQIELERLAELGSAGSKQHQALAQTVSTLEELRSP